MKYEKPCLYPVNQGGSVDYGSCDSGSYNFEGGCISGGKAGNTCSDGGYPYSVQ